MMRERIKISLAGFMALSCMALGTGCGQEAVQADRDDVELLDPVGVSLGYEAAERRNLYSAVSYAALVCPSVEEYELENGISFDGYDAFPGETVKKGSVLLHGNTENIDKQIKELEESIADMEEDYLEFVSTTEENLLQPRADRQNAQNVLDNLEQAKPEQFILQVKDGGQMAEVENPEYTKWASDYSFFEDSCRKASQKVIELEEALRQRRELYELDHAYNLTRLGYLNEDKKGLMLTAMTEGKVASLSFLTEGDWVSEKLPLMAVGDDRRPVLHCDYINKSVINKAQDVYAIINGKRYEVEYQPIEADEYKRLEEENDKVYSTFYLKSDTEEVAVGSFAAIVVLKDFRENVITVPQSAIVKEEDASFVYLQDGDRSVYTPVQTGMSDGIYTEILSGLQEGDRVRTESAAAVDFGSTVKVERGCVQSQFHSSGTLYYPSEEWVFNPVEYGTCYYVERCVSLYQQVKRGEVLARVRVVPDQLEMDRNERRLQREQERLADLRAAGEEENKKAIETKLETIAELEELIGKMRENFAVKEIKSPIDGIVTGMASYDQEELIQKKASLFVVSDDKLSYIAIEDENGVLAYGNEAEIEYTGSDGQQHVSVGRVVTLNKMAVSKNLVTGVALISVPVEDIGELAGSSQDEDGWWNRTWYDVSVDIRRMNNVLLVPKKAVIEKNGVTYVRVLQEGGEARLQSFIAGGSDSTNYWVVEGLTEGMEICLE